jgi:hypothetical protein
MMDRDLAKHVAIAVIRSCSCLGNLMPVLKEHLSDAEYAPFQKAIPNLLVEIHDRLTKPVFAAYPELEAEIDGHIDKFGQLP